VYCVWQVVKTPTVILNNPVLCRWWTAFFFTAVIQLQTTSYQFQMCLPYAVLGYIWPTPTWYDNKVRELIAVKVLHTSLLNTTVVTFKALPLGSYAPIPAPSPPFKTILGTGFVEWLSELPLYYSWCHLWNQNTFLSIFPLSSGTEKGHWRLDPVNRQGVPTQLFV